MSVEDIEDEVIENEDIDRGDDILEDDEIEDEESEEDSDLDADDDDDVEDDEEEIEEVKEIQVPKARLDEVISQRESEKERVRWLEDQLESLINQKQVEPEKVVEPVESYDFAKAEQDYANFLIEGDTSKASSIRATIDDERRKEFLNIIEGVKETSSKEALSKSAEAIDADKFDTLIENYENKYSFLDADSDSYNPEAVETVNTLLAGYSASGKTKSQALSLAVKKVAPMYEEVKPVKESLGNKKSVARRKAAKASNAQPARESSKGTPKEDAESVDISKLSEKDFDKLTTKEKRILRGD